MDSHVNLALASAKYQPIAAKHLVEISKFPMKFMNPSLIHIAEGAILRQYYDHPNTSLDLYEFTLTKTAAIQFSVNAPTICMVMMLKGKMNVVPQQHQKITNPQVPYCRLNYTEAGAYTANFPAGEHKVMFLALNQAWFKTIANINPNFQQIINPEKPTGSSIYLPACIVIREISRAITRLESQYLDEQVKKDGAVSLFVNQILTYYSQLLSSKQYVAEEEHRLKGAQIREFVEMHYSTELVEDKEKIARQLYLSVTQLMRLALKEFGMPLHQYIIFYRTAMAHKELLLTKKPIGDIAREVGYSDPLYFSKAFKKRYGISPSQVYRSKCD